MTIVSTGGAVVVTADAVPATGVVVQNGIAHRASDGAMYVTSGLSTAQAAALAGPLSTPENSMILFGDSLMNGHDGLFSSNTDRFSANGFWNWCSSKTQGVLKIVRNAGIAGNTTQDLLNRYATDVTPYKLTSRILALEGGINDPNSSITTAQSILNLRALVALAQADGFTVLLHTPPPYALSNARSLSAQLIRDGVIQIAKDTPKVVLVDLYSGWVDPASTTGAPLTNATKDGLHPAPLGARLAGDGVCYNAVLPLLTGSTGLMSSQSYSRTTLGATAKQVVRNPMMILGGGGTVSGVGSSGSAPANWTGSLGAGTATTVYSVAARSDGFGNDFKGTVSAVVADCTIQMTCANESANISNDEQFYAEFVVSVASSVNLTAILPYMNWTVNAAYTQVLAFVIDAATTMSQANMTDYVFRTPVATMGAGAITNLQMQCNFSIAAGGSGVFSINRCAIKIV